MSSHDDYIHSIVDDVRGLMQYVGCRSPRGHEPQESGVACYWLCPHCGLQLHWPQEGVTVEHTAPGQVALDLWAKR